MAQLHSPLCQVTWTETARDEERFAFEQEFPIELRFGLRIEPAFWVDGVVSLAVVAFHVFHRHQSGEFARYNHVETLSAQDLPGAPGPDLWLGMALGQAFQLTAAAGVRLSGVFDFRPNIFFLRSGAGAARPAEFAVAPEPHSFVLVPGSPSLGFESESERFVGGPGRPA